MNQLLQKGKIVSSENSSIKYTIEDYLGGGGQGEVYRGQYDGKAVAIKWYFPNTATREQREALETIIKSGAPNDRFLWPQEIVVQKGIPDFGYVMALREPRYKSIVDLMKRRISPTFRELLTAGYQLSHSFLQLHLRGLCYRDISFGNVFFDPKTGEVLICDNDNVTVNGEKKAGVLGTPRFMAPEVVRSEALPSTQTDLFSLAVLLFYMCMVHHPLEGAKEAAIRCLDLPAMTKLYGSEPIFIFDPVNDSNRPVKGLHDNASTYWAIYPQFVKKLFIRAFTDGIKDPDNGRVRESEWRAAMIRLRDAIVYCPYCGSENFFDAEAACVTGDTCWSCKRKVALPFRIVIGRNVIMLNHNTSLYPHHIDSEAAYDFSEPMAVVTQHPTDPSIWGLKNMSGGKWVATTSNGAVNDIEPGRSVSLTIGTRIGFGNLEGEICV